MADTTEVDLSVSLDQADRQNGFANRFLWLYVYRTKLLPMGGEPLEWTPEVEELRKAVEFASHTDRMFMDATARKHWTRVLYRKLEREVPGLIGALTCRASAHVMRLSMLYALLDKSDHIRKPHLDAAYALWQYCEASVQKIFGDMVSPEQQQILDHLALGPATRTGIYRDCFKNHRKAALIDIDLMLLQSRGKITKVVKESTESYCVARKQGSA